MPTDGIEWSASTAVRAKGREGPRRLAKNSNRTSWDLAPRRLPARNPFKVFLLQFFAPFADFAPFASNSGAFGALDAIGQRAGSREGREVREGREEQPRTCAPLLDLFVSEKRRQSAPTRYISAKLEIPHDIYIWLHDGMVMAL
ncbi:hypothetical protein [Gemmatimonas sp.]|uniref:hypothetical protein n=1 Tax=Gemmatimonas sp. TaxID=1962908 RepID=UPI0037C041AC